MSTGVESWGSPDQLGPLYPFVGTEVALVIICVVAWVAWHVLQIRAERRRLEGTAELYRELGLERVLGPDGVSLVERSSGGVEAPPSQVPVATAAAEEPPPAVAGTVAAAAEPTETA